MVKTKDRIPRDSKVRFSFIDNFTGREIIAIGHIRGEAKDIRIRYPEEMGELPDDAHVYLLEPESPHGGRLLVIDEEEIIEIFNKEE